MLVRCAFLGDAQVRSHDWRREPNEATPHLLEEWVRDHAMWNLALALHLPQLDWAGEGAVVRRLEADPDSATFEVTVRWTNTGQIPTALRQAQLIKIIQEDQARLAFDVEDDEDPASRVQVIDPPWTDKTIRAGHTAPAETKEVTFRARTYGGGVVEGTAHVLSTPGGVLEMPIVLDSGQPRVVADRD